MANQRREVVSYQPFRARPLLADGLLPVSRAGGEIQERVASAFFRLADEAGQRADQQAARAGALQGQQDALAGRLNASVTGGEGLTGDHRQMAADLLKKEEGFRETPYWDVNAFRTGYGSDTVTTAEGKVQKVTQGMKITRADADRDLVRRLGEFEKTAAGQVGAENWNKLPAATRAVLLSVTYNYGSLPKSVVSSVRQGGDVAGAVGSLSANKSRRAREASIIRSGGGASPTGGGPVAVDVSGGTFKPGGSNTVFGRARDEAGTKVYLQTLDAEMRSTVGQVYEKFKDDPAGLEKALGDLKSATARDHVFPEIMADFDIGFDGMADRYLSQSRENLARKVEAQDRASFIDRTASLETDQQKRLAEFDPKSPDAADAIASSQAAIDEHYDDAVDRGILDPDDAARAKLISRREAALGFYGKQAEAMDAAGVAAMRKEMETDFADGGIEGLDGDGWATLNKGLASLEEKKKTGEERAGKNYRQEGDRMAARIAAGVEVNPADMAKYSLAASTTPGGKEALRETYAKISTGRAIRDMSLPDARAYVDGLRKQYGKEPTDGELRTLAFAQESYEAKRKAIVSDSVTYAEHQGLAGETPLLVEAQNTAEMAQIMEQRAKAAADVSQRLGVPPRFLKAGEAAAVAKAVRADPANGAQIAGAIVAGAGPDAPAVLAEFGDDAPMMAEAGAIIAGDGSNRAAEDVILGYGKGADGKQMKGLKPDAAKESYSGTVGNSLVLQPKDGARIERAAAAIARKRISEEGLDPESDEALAVHERATQEAAGAVFDRGRQFGGFANVGAGFFASGTRVWVPPEIAADQFQQVLFSVTDADLDALPVKPKAGTDVYFGAQALGQTFERSKAATLRGAKPVAINGGYAFAYGDPASDDPQFVMGSDGKVFVLDLVAMRHQLEPRVPGAWR